MFFVIQNVNIWKHKPAVNCWSKICINHEVE